jgi:hypothetical protein
LVEVVLGAEIMGHYRSYQILGTIGDMSRGDDPVVQALKQSMEQEEERIFRLLGLLFPGHDFHSAHFGLRSQLPNVRANALEFLDNVLKPQFRHLVVPLFDPYTTVRDRIALARRVLGADVQSREEAVSSLLVSDDPWLKSCGVYAIGAFGLRSMEGELDRWIDAADPLLRETARSSKERLASSSKIEEPEGDTAVDAWPSSDTMGVG